MTQFQKPLVQANGCIQYPVAMQCAICFFPLTRPVLSPCHNFCHSFATCVAIAFARNEVCPFRCRVCCQGLLLATQILPLNLPPVLLPPPTYLPVFFATDVATAFAPSVLPPPMLPCRLPPPLPLPLLFALEVAMFVAIKFGCHQIWAPNMEEIGGARKVGKTCRREPG